MINRRTFLSASAAGIGLAVAAPRRLLAEDGAASFDLIAGPATAPLLGSEGPASALWAYGGISPGPVIRGRQGDLIKVRLHNNLPQPTSTHWHGIRIDNAMDGVSGLTQDAVPPGGFFDYAFVAPDAGTYWYHSHNKSWEQMARGLYGPLIIEERNPPPVDREMVLVIDDWRLGEDGQIHTASFGQMRDWSHGGRLGNWLTINGVSTPDLKVKRGERLRLRLINCANSRILNLKLGQLAPLLIALDGQPLAQPEEIGTSAVLTLAPAQRADLLLDVTLEPGEEAPLTEVSRKDGIVVGNFVSEGISASGQAGRELPVLPSNRLPEPHLSDPLKLDLVMEGGAMGGMRSAVFEGKSLSMRDLVARGQVWAFNGVAGMTENPLARIQAGRSVVLNIVNETAWPHAMHIHGHHFRAVARNGQPVDDGAWRDTELIGPDEAVTVAFVADNPGKWLIHCHMLEHQAAGMKTWFQVAG
ncbi:multicopper oxidase family protein [Pelagibius sp. Alg239-R121]|uniref:multicopper oxidase family protein n=1 Tax=Pelagibius sp. Alg239-R121 TaxID=2993448 RepID=UPI0024A6E5AA|nr:multicopper oxidase family protein [Pelagibius sp. Alg239-R121]